MRYCEIFGAYLTKASSSFISHQDFFHCDRAHALHEAPFVSGVHHIILFDFYPHGFDSDISCGNLMDDFLFTLI